MQMLIYPETVTGKERGRDIHQSDCESTSNNSYFIVSIKHVAPKSGSARKCLGFTSMVSDKLGAKH